MFEFANCQGKLFGSVINADYTWWMYSSMKFAQSKSVMLIDIFEVTKHQRKLFRSAVNTNYIT